MSLGGRQFVGSSVERDRSVPDILILASSARDAICSNGRSGLTPPPWRELNAVIVGPRFILLSIRGSGISHITAGAVRQLPSSTPASDSVCCQSLSIRQA